MSKFLLLLGPSGVGKTTLIHQLREMDSRFVYISPYMTRPPREGETDKISISDERMDHMRLNNEFVAVNTLFGIRYGTPKTPIVQAFEQNRFPLLDWPIDHVHIMNEHFPHRLVRVYIAPPSLEELKRRLVHDTRDPQNVRFETAMSELTRFQRGEFDGLFDVSFVHENQETHRVAESIYAYYRTSIGEGFPPPQERKG